MGSTNASKNNPGGPDRPPAPTFPDDPNPIPDRPDPLPLPADPKEPPINDPVPPDVTW